MRGLVEQRFVLVAAAVAALSAIVLVVLLPSTGVGADGTVYAAMARHPLGMRHQLGPYPFRILIPLLVWLSPLAVNFSFHVLTVLGLVVGGSVTGLFARELGVSPHRSLAAPALYVFSFAGVYGVYQYRMIDSESAALTASALLLAWRGRRLPFVLVSIFASAAREYGATVGLAWWAAQRGRGRELQALYMAVLLGLPAIAVYIGLRYAIPHPPGGSVFAYGNGSVTDKHGLPRYISRSVVQGFGLLFILWPFGILLGSRRWQSFHLYAIGLVPFLWVTDLNRMAIYLLPFVIPSALLALERASALIFAIAVVANGYVAVVLSLHNIPNSAGYPSSGAMLVAGALVALVASAVAIRATAGPLRARLSELKPGSV